MITYDFTYFHTVLLRLKSVDFNHYQHLSEKDLLINALSGEEITDYSEIDWRWISDELYSEVYSDNKWTFSFEIDGKLEKFIRHIIPRDEVVRILTFLRDHCRECLFGEVYNEQCVCDFETECARLISQNIEESKAYQQRLADAGVTVEWVPLESLIDGYGAAHCMTQVLKRY